MQPPGLFRRSLYILAEQKQPVAKKYLVTCMHSAINDLTSYISLFTKRGARTRGHGIRESLTTATANCSFPKIGILSARSTCLGHRISSSTNTLLYFHSAVMWKAGHLNWPPWVQECIPVLRSFQALMPIIEAVIQSAYATAQFITEPCFYALWLHLTNSSFSHYAIVSGEEKINKYRINQREISTVLTETLTQVCYLWREEEGIMRDSRPFKQAWKLKQMPEMP